MLVSIIFILLFFSGLLGVLLFPKTEERLNGVKVIIMGIMAILCYQSLTAWVFNKLGIQVNIQSTSIAMLFFNLILWGNIIKKKKKQKLFWRIFDIIGIVVCIIFVLGISVHIFSADLMLQYANIDAASHFQFAMNVVNTGKLDTIYFSAYVDAMVIQLFAPFIEAIQYYKAFIVADIFMHILEISMFYVLVITISEKKVVRALAPVFSIAYFFGYPSYSYMTGNFVYWSNGVMILIFITYTLLLIGKNSRLNKYNVVLLLLGAFANTGCNKLFIPINTVLIVIAVFMILFPKLKEMKGSKLMWGCIAVAIVLVFAIIGIYIKVWGESLNNISEILLENGGIYRSMYADLIFFLPAFFLVIFYSIKKRMYYNIICGMSAGLIICTIGMYVLWYNHYMSTYYYYKVYYNLWLFGWLLVIVALDFMDENKQLVPFFSYLGMIVGICYITLSNYDYKMWHHNVEYNGSYATKQIFSLYRYNMDSLLTNYEENRISDLALDAFHISLEEYGDENIPIITTNSVLRLWYDSITSRDSYICRLDVYEFPDIIFLLDAYHIDKIMVDKKDETYQLYERYYSECKKVFENEDVLIIEPKDELWSDVFSMYPEYSYEKQALFAYIRDAFPSDNIPLLADKSSYIDIIMYSLYTGKSLEKYYTWKYNALENIENLNKEKIQYIVLLKDDPYYQQNSTYFDTQRTMYENSAGKIIQHTGSKWNTDYGEVNEEQ